MKHRYACFAVILAIGLLLVSLCQAGTAAASNEEPPPQVQGQDAPGSPRPTTPSWQPAALTSDVAVIAVFDDPAYVDTGGFTSSESDNVQAGLAAMGHIVQPFVGTSEAAWTTALSGANVLVIPELENSPGLAGDLAPGAITAIADFVNEGRGLIDFSNGPQFLNPIFGFSLTFDNGAPSTLTIDAVGTAFEGGPASLPWNNATSWLGTAGLPAGARAIYSSAVGNAEVAVLPYGAGQIVFMGWDWYDAAPPGSQDGGWLEVLERAVTQVESDFLGLTPWQTRAIDIPGATVVYTHTLINSTGLTDTFSLALSGNTWPATLPFAVTPVLTDGATLDFAVEVTIPPAAAPGSADEVRVVATSTTSPTVFSAGTTLRTVAICPNNFTIVGQSAETMFDLDDSWDYGGQTFGFARIGLYSEDGDTLDAALRARDATGDWVEIAQIQDVGNVALFDGVFLPEVYTALNVQLDDTDNNDWIHYDYEFIICRSPTVDIDPEQQVQAYAEPGESAVFAYTVTNYMMAPGQFALSTSGATWPSSVRTTTGTPLSQTPVLGDRETYTFTVWIDVPPGVEPGALDEGTVVATSVAQPALSDSGTFAAVALSGQYGYAFGAETNQITIVDTVIHEAVGSIDTTPYGNSPFLGGLSPDGSELYVGLTDSDSVLVVDTTTQTPVSPPIAVGNRPRNVAFTPDGAYALVPNRGADTLSVIDTATRSVVDTLTMGDSPMNVATSPCLTKALVTNRESGSVSFINLNTLSVSTVITGFDAPWGVAISPYGLWAYVTNQRAGTISVIDTGSENLIATWDVGGDWLQAIDVSPDGRTLFVVDADRGALLLVDAFSGDLLETIPADRTIAWYVEAFPADKGPYAYFSRPEGDGRALGVVNTETAELVRTIVVPGGDSRGLSLFPMESACLAGTVALSPVFPHKVARAGESVVFHQTVTNLSADTGYTFDLTLGGTSWPATLSTTSVGPLPPGTSAEVTVTVEVPADAPAGAPQAVALTATGGGASGGGASDTASLTASVIRPGFVMNESEDRIHVVDTVFHLDSGIEIDLTGYGEEPLRGALSPDGTELYVSLRTPDAVVIVDAVAFTPVLTVPVGLAPQPVAFRPDGAYAFVGNRGDGTVSVIDTGTHAVVKTVPVGEEPIGLAPSVCEGELYVSNLASNDVTVIDMETLTVTAVITGFARPRSIVISPWTGKAYVSNQADGTIGVIDLATDALVDTWPIPQAVWLSDLDVSLDGRRLYVGDAETGDLFVLDAATGELLVSPTGVGRGWASWEVETFLPGAGPFTYVTFPHNGWIGVLNNETRAFEDVIPLGHGGALRGMALFPPVDVCGGLPEASFTPTDIVIHVNETVDFANASTGYPVPTFTWDFGDGSPVSTLENPSHTYTEAGVYTVTLTAENLVGTDMAVGRVEVLDWLLYLPRVTREYSP